MGWGLVLTLVLTLDREETNLENLKTVWDCLASLLRFIKYGDGQQW